MGDERGGNTQVRKSCAVAPAIHGKKYRRIQAHLLSSHPGSPKLRRQKNAARLWTRTSSEPIRRSDEGTAVARMESPRSSLGYITALTLLFMTCVALRTAAAEGRTEAEAAEALAKAQRVQGVIDELRGHLSLRRDVVAAIVPVNPLVVGKPTDASVNTMKNTEYTGSNLARPPYALRSRVWQRS